MLLMSTPRVESVGRISTGIAARTEVPAKAMWAMLIVLKVAS